MPIYFYWEDKVSAQAILFEGSNNILVQYANPSDRQGLSATEGLQGSGFEGDGLLYGYDSSVLTSGLAICYNYPGSTDTTCGTAASLVEVGMDIQFCGNPNAFNCKKNGIVPVTVFGSELIDVQEIDLTTVRLCLEDLSECTSAPVDFSMADRAAGADDRGTDQCTCISFRTSS